MTPAVFSLRAMTSPHPSFCHDFRGKTIVVTGGAGVLCSAIARGLADHGANVVLLDRDGARAESVRRTLVGAPERHRAFSVDVLSPPALQSAAEAIQGEFGAIDGLVNGAGGNIPGATTGPERSFFDVPVEALDQVTRLNLLGTILPCQAFGRPMVSQGHGVILNISSMNALRPLTRIVGYSAAKAAVSNFTAWLSVHMGREYSPRIRVNAIAPGFFLTEQNRFLLTEPETGQWSARGQQILAATPLGRLGTPDDLLGAALFLLSPASSFVSGIVMPVDGGFSAYSGV